MVVKNDTTKNSGSKKLWWGRQQYIYTLIYPVQTVSSSSATLLANTGPPLFPSIMDGQLWLASSVMED